MRLTLPPEINEGLCHQTAAREASARIDLPRELRGDASVWREVESWLQRKKKAADFLDRLAAAIRHLLPWLYRALEPYSRR